MELVIILRTERMGARKLRLLRILGLQDVTNAVEELDVTLVGVLLNGRDERPRHGTGGLCVDGSVGTTTTVSIRSPYTRK